MALPVNKLTKGVVTFRFVRFHRADAPTATPELIAEQSEVISRPGVDGIIVTTTGERGVAFPMACGVDVASRFLAHDLVRKWQNQRNTGRFRLTTGGVDYHARYRTDYIILSVEKPAIRGPMVSAGGLTGSGTGRFWVEAVFILQPVAVP